MEDPAFRAEVRPYTDPSSCQGTYVIFLAQTGLPPRGCTSGPLSAPVRGMGPSPRQMLEVIDLVGLYVDIENPSSAEVARDIDRQFHRNIDKIDYATQRYYGGGTDHDQFDKHRLWTISWDAALDGFRDEVDSVDESGLDDFLSRSFPYPGLAGDVGQRYSQHLGFSKTTSRLMGLIRAIMEYKYPQMFGVDGFFFQVLRTVKVDDIGLDEIITCLLVSGMPWDGGLNFDWPGSSTGRKDGRGTDEYLRKLRESEHFISKHGFQERHVDESLEEYSLMKTRITEYKANVAALVSRRQAASSPADFAEGSESGSNSSKNAATASDQATGSHGDPTKRLSVRGVPKDVALAANMLSQMAKYHAANPTQPE